LVVLTHAPRYQHRYQGQKWDAESKPTSECRTDHDFPTLHHIEDCATAGSNARAAAAVVCGNVLLPTGLDIVDAFGCRRHVMLFAEYSLVLHQGSIDAIILL